MRMVLALSPIPTCELRSRFRSYSKVWQKPLFVHLNGGFFFQSPLMLKINKNKIVPTTRLETRAGVPITKCTNPKGSDFLFPLEIAESTFDRGLLSPNSEIWLPSRLTVSWLAQARLRHHLGSGCSWTSLVMALGTWHYGVSQGVAILIEIMQREEPTF